MSYSQRSVPNPETLADRLANAEAAIDSKEAISIYGVHFYAGGFVPVALTSGTDTAGINGTVWISEMRLGGNALLTGFRYLIGSVGGTDKAIAILFDANGVVLATSALAGTTVGTTATFQDLVFTTAFQAPPGLYYIGIVYNGNTAKIRTQAAGGHNTAAISQTFGTPVAIAVPSTFTAANGPIGCTY